MYFYACICTYIYIFIYVCVWCQPRLINPDYLSGNYPQHDEFLFKFAPPLQINLWFSRGKHYPALVLRVAARHPDGGQWNFWAAKQATSDTIVVQWFLRPHGPMAAVFFPHSCGVHLCFTAPNTPSFAKAVHSSVPLGSFRAGESNTVPWCN